MISRELTPPGLSAVNTSTRVGWVFDAGGRGLEAISCESHAGAAGGGDNTGDLFVLVVKEVYVDENLPAALCVARVRVRVRVIIRVRVRLRVRVAVPIWVIDCLGVCIHKLLEPGSGLGLGLGHKLLEPELGPLSKTV